MLLLQADKGLAICSQIPALARPVLPRAEEQLLHNLLAWLGCRLLPDAARRHFVWPLPSVPGDDAVLAGRSLQGFLEQAAQETGFTRLLLLGSQGSECLQQVAATPVPWKAWSTHSLSELLAMPVLKREAWQHLLSLHAGLR